MLITKREVVNYLVRNKVLVTVDVLQKLEDPKIYEDVLNTSINPTIFQQQLESIIKQKSEFIKGKSTVKTVFTYQEKHKKKSLQDFIKYFKNRYKAITSLLQQRQEMKGITSISRILTKTGSELVSIVGMVVEKKETKNGHFIFTIEDPSGQVNMLVNKSREELHKKAQDIMLDEIIGVVGKKSKDIIFVNNILHPNIPISNELKKSEDEVYAVILSDLHIGSKYFLEKEFNKFISWIQGKTGTEKQKKIAQKVGYIFIVGDMIDGIGIYPSQQDELTIQDITEQYKMFVEYVKQLPTHLPIIMCSGNHEDVRLAEPQPFIDKASIPELFTLPNIHYVSNPGIVNIHHSENFSGFNVLLYHGYSYDFYADQVPSIKNSGAHISDRSVLVMKYLLQRRHLAPTYTSTLFVPDDEQDALVIDQVPDIFLSGHIHKSGVGVYRGVTIVSGSCFQAKTGFQEKVGHEPDPCRVPIINLQTRNVTILNFNEE